MSTGRHHLAPDAHNYTAGRRSAFNSLRKMPSALFRSEKPRTPDEPVPSLREKKPRGRALAGLLGRSKPTPPPLPAFKSPNETHMTRSAIVPEHKQRPSCGPDPFVRPVPEGVRIIQHAHSPPPKPSSVKAMEAERHGSVLSRKYGPARPTARSMRGITTINIDDIDNLDDPLVDDDGTTLSSLVNAASIRQHSRSPLRDLGVDELPMRNASLSMVSWPKPSHLMALAEAEEPPEVPLPRAPPCPAAPSPQLESAENSKPPLAKEKTRSKVWGVLSGKRSSKSKAGVPPCVRSSIDDSSSLPHIACRSSVSQPACRSSISQPAGCSSISQPARASAHIRPPTLHITHPSQDGEIPPPSVMTRGVVADPDSPFVSREPSASLTPEQGMLDATSNPAARRTPSAATSRKSVPKRKSLAGLFGLSFQKSMDKLRSNSPVPPMPQPSMPEPPSTPVMPPHNLMDDTSPDTAAFYSRQGTRSGFNFHGDLLHPDAVIHDVTSANYHLHALVSDMPVSPTTRRADPGTPTPLRRTRSGLHKTPSSPPKSGRSSAPPASPSKSIARSLGKVFDRDSTKTPASPSPSSPVKSMVRSVCNRLAGSPERLSVMANSKTSASHLRPDSVLSIASDMSDTSAATTNHIMIEVGAGDGISSRRSVLDVPHDVEIGPSPLSVRSAAPRAHPPPPSAFSSGHTRVGSQPPILSLDFGTPSRPMSMFTDMFGQLNSSKSSMASIQTFSRSGRNSNRDTFDFAAELAALKASDDGHLIDTLRIARSIELSTESPDEALAQLEEVLESRKDSAETLRGRERRSNPPFQGRLAFQLNVAKARNSPGPPPPFALPPSPPGHADSDHKKQPSAISFASMSSLGTPWGHVDRGHTSYFEQAFAAGTLLPPLPALPPVPKAFGATHHRRMSSGISLDSVTSPEIAVVTARTSGHRREVSSVSIGRSDWASRRRASRDSIGSIARLGSIQRLGRPGLGDRMFEGHSFGTDSEPDMSALASPTFGTRPYSTASTDEMLEPTSEESFFGTNQQRQRSFSILDKGRPLSHMSVESDVNDTFDFVDGPSKRGAVEVGIVAAYENDSPAHRGSTPSIRMEGIKPRARHRPPRLYLPDDDDTPSLISPSDLTEASSLFSLDTARASNPPPRFTSHSHAREGGSITSIVNVQPTIREQASDATIRRPEPNEDEARAAWELVQELHTRKWDHVGDVAQSLLTRSPWGSTQPPVPHTRAEIEAILTESMARYKPLGETGKVHRRESSLNNTRASVAPYTVAPTPLETRFQSKRSSGETVSLLLAEFARDVVPHPRPEIRAGPGPSPLSMKSSVRLRVPSEVRRDNLGWGRRRYSDEPAPCQPQIALGKKTTSATQASFPSFLAFSPEPTAPIASTQSGPLQQPPATKAVVSSRPAQPRALKPKPSTKEHKPSNKEPKPSTKAVPRVQKRIHVKTDSKGSPVSVRSLRAPARDLAPPRPDSAPLTARSANVRPKHATNVRRVHKTKSSPEVRRFARKGEWNKENGAPPSPPTFVLPPPRPRPRAQRA